MYIVGDAAYACRPPLVRRAGATEALTRDDRAQHSEAVQLVRSASTSQSDDLRDPVLNTNSFRRLLKPCLFSEYQ